jgi:cobalamin transport system substrate-binding protein
MNTKNTKDTKITKITKPFRVLRSVMPKNLPLFVPFVSFVFVLVLFVPFVSAQRPQRIISLVPALTEMLYAIGAGPQMVAVSSYDEYPPEVKALPKVGALVDPDTERIFSLKPDLVITYGSQTDLQAQLDRASIPFFNYRHGGLSHIMTTMRELGVRTGHAKEADLAARAIERRIQLTQAGIKGARRPRTLLVFGREPRTLRNIYASGGRGFLHDMLEAAGGEDVFADIDRESVQATTELILARAPEVILELRSGDIRDREGTGMKMEIESWSPLASVPAVKNGRVIILTGNGLVVPGPRVADGIERMARALHPR